MQRRLLFFLLVIATSVYGQRERLNFDLDWRFALGHAYDTDKDYGHNQNTFISLAKAGYGDGPASQNFDDRYWRTVNVPHDWCVALPFSEKGSSSHGSKAIGKYFPENSIGWYRNHFFIPASDKGRRVVIEFDGVYRNSNVWINGFFVGNEPSGYNSFHYDITDYLNYDGDNVVAVRVDATLEEGWFYEGAGIYRHVWLTKTDPLHVTANGTFITSEIVDQTAMLKSRINVQNDNNQPAVFDVEEQVLDQKQNVVSSINTSSINLASLTQNTFNTSHKITNPQLWSLENPYLYKVKTILKKSGKVVDEYTTTIGIRSVRFDANTGFYLNGKPVKITGVNNHQDHAGVGCAIPDAIQEFRIKQLKAMGCNAIRTSHNPPTPEFLDACDRLGMLVMDENRLMGVNAEHFRCLESLMKRDRNHPSVFIWSLGNEEWHIEGNIKGAIITQTMQDFAKRLDSSRTLTVACSGGWDTGIGTVSEVMGYNYLKHGDVDEHHKKFPWQPSIGTEESNTISTRGTYFTNDEQCHLAPKNLYDDGAEGGWKYYASRPFLAGLFYWTGLDYRGEPTPYGWPAVTSQFGITDLCGYPKDIYYYFQSWWTKEPVLYIYPHWNLKGMEGKTVKVTVYSNAEEVEIVLNKKSLGKKKMPVNGHLDWDVVYATGTLTANSFKNGKLIKTTSQSTTGNPASLQITSDKTQMLADKADACVVTLKTIDNKNLFVPDANLPFKFSISGPAKMIGVGNGDPVSHESEQFSERVDVIRISPLKEFPINNFNNRSEVKFEFDDSNWKSALPLKKDWKAYADTLLVVRGIFELPELSTNQTITLFGKSILEDQSVYVNGTNIAQNVKRDASGQAYVLSAQLLRKGKNTIAFTGKRFKRKYEWDYPNTDPGLVSIYTPCPTWERKTFNGLAQVLIQSTGGSGKVILKAESPGLPPAMIELNAIKTQETKRVEKK